MTTHMLAHGNWVGGRFAGATHRGPYSDDTIRVKILTGCYKDAPTDALLRLEKPRPVTVYCDSSNALATEDTLHRPNGSTSLS